MPSIETLLSEYIAEHRAGGTADPVEFAGRATPDERRKLAALLDDYLAHAPRVGLADQAVPDPRLDMTVEALMRSIDGASGLWPAMLPRLRKRAGLKRRELVERLAATLGVSDR